jgi:hypothetical protein
MTVISTNVAMACPTRITNYYYNEVVPASSFGHEKFVIYTTTRSFEPSASMNVINNINC